MSRPLVHPRVSVVMSARNAGESVRRAVESLQRQTLSDFELVVVDDGSSDRTGEILDRIAEKDLRINVLHRANVGASAALGVALGEARGSYVLPMEATGWAEPELLADLVDAMERDRLELVVSSVSVDSLNRRGETVSEVIGHEDALYATQAEFRSAAWQLFDAGLLDGVMGKLYQRERIEGLGLRLGPEDASGQCFILGYLRDVERVGVLGHAGLHQGHQAEADAPAWQPDLYDRLEREHAELLNLYRHWGLDGDPASMEVVQRRYLDRLVGCIGALYDSSCTLSTEEKRALVERMITSERAQLAVQVARPRSRAAALMLTPIRTKNVPFALIEARFLSLLRR